MIPRKIHYCWFGGAEMPKDALRCIESWRKWCPDFELVRWDETNFDLDKYPYAREAYDAKKWAFVTDVVRLYALVVEGGIYMDTDVEVVGSLEPLLEYDAVSGFESQTRIPTGLMAAQPRHPLMVELLNEYNTVHFALPDGRYDLTTNVIRITNACLKYGFKPNNTKQTVAGFTLLPKDYLCPKDFDTGNLEITDNTIAIHHFDGSWLDGCDRDTLQIQKLLSQHIPAKMARRIARVVATFSHKGLKGSVQEFADWKKAR